MGDLYLVLGGYFICRAVSEFESKHPISGCLMLIWGGLVCGLWVYSSIATAQAQQNLQSALSW